MTDTVNQNADGSYEFTINYSERELTCRVQREENTLKLQIDNNINAEFEVGADSSLTQTSGPDLPSSVIEFIKKNVLGQDK